MQIKEIVYQITQKCNFMCEHCGQEHLTRNNELSSQIVVDKIIQSDFTNNCVIAITGGEPFIKDEAIISISRLVNNEKNFFVGVTTNGYFVNKIESTILKISPENRKRIKFYISVDGIDSIHNEIRVNNNAFQKVVETITMLRSYNIDIVINTVMQEKNLQMLDSIKNYFVDLDESIEFKPITFNYMMGKNEIFPYTQKQMEIVCKYITEQSDIKYILSNGKFKIQQCHSGNLNCVINSEGDVYPCYFKGIVKSDKGFLWGNLRDKSFEQIFTSDKRRFVLNHYVATCDGCNANCDIQRENNLYGINYQLNQNEIKQLFLLKDDKQKCIYNFSFGPKEFDQNRSFHWMLQNTCELYIENPRFIDAELKIILENPINKKIKLQIIIADNCTNFTCSPGENDITISIKNLNELNDIITINLICHKLWSPSEIYGTSDCRKLGFKIFNIYFTNCEKLNKMELESQMYNREIDVAQIMRQIKRKAEENRGDYQSDKNYIKDEVIIIKQEIKRIDEFLQNTIQDSKNTFDIGKIIPVRKAEKDYFRKLKIFYKRLVRKSTRFLFEEQISFNSKIIECVTALKETQTQLIKVLDLLEQEKSKNNLLLQRIELLEAGVNANVTEHNLCENYVQFENYFRGTESDIKKRLMYYYEEYVKQLGKNNQGKILDIGCGRGEWLELLREKGINASGIDINKFMVEICKQKNLDAQLIDGLELLKTQQGNSLRLVTAFQVVEHLPVQDISVMIKEIYRVLEIGGLAILETPNPENLEVGACNFYLDPTHIRIIHPEYLKYLALNAGFSYSEISYWKEDEIKKWWELTYSDETTDICNSIMFRALLDLVKKNLSSCPDYALILRK